MTEDRRVAKTHDAIAEALLALIDEQGYAKVTVRDICERANVGRSTFYTHFEGKAGCFLASHHAALAPLTAGLLDETGLVGEATPPALTALFDYHYAHRKRLRDVFTSADGPYMRDALQRQLAARLAASLSATFDEGQSALPFRLLAESLSGAQVHLMFWWLTVHTGYDATAMADAYHRLQRGAIVFNVMQK